MIDGRRQDSYALQGPLIRRTFELYATGQFSLTQLLELMADEGLRTRNGQPPVRSKLASILVNPVYAGWVPWHGELHAGVHDPLVNVELFNRVQQVLAEHSNGHGEVRQRHHAHYLKGSLYCESCGSRLSNDVHLIEGRRYHYFHCLGRHAVRTGCQEPYVPVEDLESEVEVIWWRVYLPDSTKRLIREGIRAAVERRLGDPSFREAKQLRLEQLKRSKQKVVDGYLAEIIPLEVARQKRLEIEEEIAKVQAQLESDRELLSAPELIERGFVLIDSLRDTYLSSKAGERRSLNQLIFDGFWVGGRTIRRYAFRERYSAFLEANPSNSDLMVDPRVSEFTT